MAALATSWLLAGASAARAQVTAEPSAVVFPDPAKFAHGLYTEGEVGAVSFFGKAFSEPKLLGYGYDFEQASKARVLPKYTPPLPSDAITGAATAPRAALSKNLLRSILILSLVPHLSDKNPTNGPSNVG